MITIYLSDLRPKDARITNTDENSNCNFNYIMWITDSCIVNINRNKNNHDHKNRDYNPTKWLQADCLQMCCFCLHIKTKR